jgi:hypothetical protein
MLLSVLLFAGLQDTVPNKPETMSAAKESRFSDCVLKEIAQLEKTSVDALNSFSRKNASKAMKICQPVKSAWVQDLDQELSKSGEFNDSTLRKAEVNKIVSVDELSVGLLIYARGK